jgi:hypothetical protein
VGIDSQAFNTAIRGSPTLPQLTTTGQMESSVEMTGPAITVPQLVMGAVTILNANPIFGTLRIPVLATDGEINPDNTADLPILQVNGTILAGATIRGVAVPLPLIQPSGINVNPQFGEGLVLLPQLRTTGSTIAGGAAILVPTTENLGRGASTLPALEANGFLLIPQEMAAVALTLPALDVGPLSILAGQRGDPDQHSVVDEHRDAGDHELLELRLREPGELRRSALRGDGRRHLPPGGGR